MKAKALFYRSVCAIVSRPTRSALLTQELPGRRLSQADTPWVERVAALAFTQNQLSLLLTNLHKHTKGTPGPQINTSQYGHYTKDLGMATISYYGGEKITFTLWLYKSSTTTRHRSTSD